MSWIFIWIAGAGVILFLLLALLFKGVKPLPGEDGYEEHLASLGSHEPPPNSNAMAYVILMIALAGLALWIADYYHFEILKYFLRV